MPLVTQSISILQQFPENIRNICILAHVDHGKTTLSDSLLASNGLISPKMAGKVRYMDSRADEQERGITMKSSCVAIHFNVNKGADQPASDYLINLIDSPGHVDFSCEVSTATRLCDGCLVIVDVVEGVCSQTHSVLRQAFIESVQPILLLNKLDRLIGELKLSPPEAHLHLSKIIEQVNAIMAGFDLETFLHHDNERHKREKSTSAYQSGTENPLSVDAERNHLDVDGNLLQSLHEMDMTQLQNFLPIYAKKLGMNSVTLLKCLWGDFYMDPKTKRVIQSRALKGRVLKPLFVQFILEPIWTVYDAISENREKLEKIVQTLSLKVLPRDLRSKDSKALRSTIFSQWLPLSLTVLSAVVQHLPSPLTAQKYRIPKLMHTIGNSFATTTASSALFDLQQSLVECDSSDAAPIVSFTSKMQSVLRADLPESKRTQPTSEELRLRRQILLQERRQTLLSTSSSASASAIQKQEEAEVAVVMDPLYAATEEPQEPHVLVGISRLYSGKIHVGQTLYLLLPSYLPSAETSLGSQTKQVPITHNHCISTTVTHLYALMARDFLPMPFVTAGSIFGVRCNPPPTSNCFTLTSNLSCPSFARLNSDLNYAAMIQFAIAPSHHSQFGALKMFLERLTASDPALELSTLDTGELVIGCTGEVHLDRIRRDILDAGLEVTISSPVVSFRETGRGSGVAEVSGGKIQKLKVSCTELREKDVDVSGTVNDNNATDVAPLTGESVLSGTPPLSISKKSDKCWLENRTASSFAFILPSLLKRDAMQRYETSLIAGFQMASISGPLCNEPISHVVFGVEEFELELSDGTDGDSVSLGGQIICAMRDACRAALLDTSPRLMLAMYSCSVQAMADVLGKVYAVISKRHGSIISEEMMEGTPFFLIKAKIPVVESFGFSEDIRKRSSGAAQPQLVFYGWEVLEQNPFWTPSTEEELLDMGEKADRENLARKYMDSVRRRKGLLIDEKIVQHAEKQRTLKIK